MPIPLVPYVPDFITVHLGAPDEDAQNVIVSFPDYIKNVASSEIYPTWSEAAIYANIYAQISYALNRVYTEYYRSRGYNFNITSSTAYDQKFIYGRNIFENIDRIVDDIFTTYIRRVGFIEPLAAKYCNGTTVTCEGLSQWGSEELAREGYSAIEILKYYYGNNIELVTNAPIAGIVSLYPGRAYRKGDTGGSVTLIQTFLNTISGDYPLIPKIDPVDGVFGENTENAVSVFQQIFNLTPDGVVGRATWNKMVLLYTGIKNLSELVSEGQQYVSADLQFPESITVGAVGPRVSSAQYFLLIISKFDPRINSVPVTGEFGQLTFEAIKNFQSVYGLDVTGVIDEQTWNTIYDTYSAIINVVLRGGLRMENVVEPTQYPGRNLEPGNRD
ncbi:MAG: peptidoglycan-binding protein [Clostridia bacterium]|nr:peptidoglycan-binding protein [Clostridia bacterium]